MNWGDNALTAPTTPGKRVAVVDRSKVDPQMVKAAEGMEAMFLDYMMKVMRQTVPKNEMDLESPATQIYTSMMDSETAQRAARAGGVGLADQIIAYLESHRYTLPKGHAAPVRTPPDRGGVQGGTHAGQSERE
jgi:flagellar protein FlgJ